MTHDDLVIWAYEHADQLVEGAGFIPDNDAALRCDAAQRNFTGRMTERRWRETWSAMCLEPRDLRQCMPMYQWSKLGQCSCLADWLALLAKHEKSAIEDRHNRYDRDGLRRLRARIMQALETPPFPEIEWPPEPPAWYRITGRTLELPVMADGGRRFIDLAVDVEHLDLFIDEHGYGHVGVAFQARYFFEIKPTIRRLDEVLRQCRTYCQVNGCSGIAVVSPDTRYQTILTEQGFPFIVPGIGQQSLGF